MTTTKQETTLSLVKRTVVDVVVGKVDEFIRNGELDLPATYSVANALKAAWLVLQATEDKTGRKALETCTRDSIANALLDMVVQGLSPHKSQVYFIVYGTTLTAQRSYFGSMAVARRVNPRIDDFAYAAVYEGDVFRYGIVNGRKTVIQHEQTLENIDKRKILGAYAIALDNEGEPIRAEILTMDEISQAWAMSRAKPFSDDGGLKAGSTHEKFTAAMAVRTAVNKLCRHIINASSDRSLLIDRLRRAEDIADQAAAEAEIEEMANTGDIIDSESPVLEASPVPVPPPEDFAPAECPDQPGIFYKRTHCDACAKREGCPAWPQTQPKQGGPPPELRPEPKPKPIKKGPGF